MSFRETLKGLIAPDKAADADKVFDALDKQLGDYDKDIRELKASLRSKDGIKPEDFARLEEENTELRKANADTARALKKAEGDAKAAGETASQFRDRTHRLMKDDGLRKALVDAGVKKEYLDAAHALLLRDIQVDDEKGEAFAMLAKDGKETRFAIADHVNTWAAGEQGKNFIGVPPSSGGGAQGGAGAGSGKAISMAEFSAKSPSERADYMAAGGTYPE